MSRVRYKEGSIYVAVKFILFYTAAFVKEKFLKRRFQPKFFFSAVMIIKFLWSFFYYRFWLSPTCWNMMGLSIKIFYTILEV